MTSLLKFCLVTLAFTLVCYHAFCQDDWKANYEIALKAYQAGDFLVAMNHAENAYAKAADQKSKAYTLQILTATSIAIENTGKGLAFIDEEIKLFGFIEGANGKNVLEALKKQITLLALSGDLQTASEKATVFTSVVEKTSGKSNEYGLALLQQGNLLASLGDYRLAQQPLTQSLVYLKTNPETFDDYMAALFLSAVADKKMKDLPAAEQKLKEYILQADKNERQQTAEYQQAKTELSELKQTGQNPQSEILSDKSISARQKNQYFFKTAVQFHSQNKLDSAIKYYTLCEQLISEFSFVDNTSFSVSMNLASILIGKKNLSEAEKAIDKAKLQASTLYPENSAERCSLLITEGDLLLLQGQNQAAEKNYLSSADCILPLPLKERIKPTRVITKKLLKANRFQSALKTINPLANDPGISQCMSEKGLIDFIVLYCAVLESNQSTEGVKYLTSQISKLNESENKRILQVQLATAFIQAGNSRDAEKILQDILKAQEVNTSLYGEAAYELARVQQRVGDFHNAEKNYLDAIKSYQHVSTGNEEAVAEVYNSFATFYMTLGNYNAAEHLYDDLIKQTDPNSEFYSVLRQNLAAIYEQTMRYNEAKKLLEATLQRDKFILGTSHPDYAITLQNLAALYQKTGELTKAKTLFTLALKIDKDNGSDQSLSYASKLANLGTVYQQLGDPDQAKIYFEDALKIREAKAGKDHPDYIFNLYNLAVLNQQQNNFDQAYSQFKTVSDFYLHQINDLFPSLSELEKTAFYNKISDIIYAYQNFAIAVKDNKKSIAGDLYNFRLATKALLLNASTKIRNRIVNSSDATLLARFNEWQHVKESLARLYGLDLEEKIKQQKNIEILQTRVNELEKYLSAQSELFADAHENRNVTWQNVQAALKSDEAAVEMIRLKVNQKQDSIVYAALVLTKGIAEPRLVVLPHGDQLEGREFMNYKNCIQFIVEDKRSYSFFWLPLNSYLNNIHTIYFSPDGVYNKMNLGTLFDTSTGQYLIERVNIHLVSNTKEILNLVENLPANPTAALVGFPDYNLKVENETELPIAQLRDFNLLKRAEIPELPGTKEEVLKINELLTNQKWQVNLYMREQATEENVKKLSSPSVLHIATHGFFIESKNDNTPIIFSRDLSQKENNPLLRSGLILAGAENDHAQTTEQTPTEDGILTALEAMNLNLDNTNLVVLSACETGSGQIRNGEGVFGLQRSFLVSGAGSVMMSLWKVNDEATQELMVEFYKNWLTSGNKAEAFRKTQLALKEKYSSPYYWGSFIMMGK